MKATTASTLLLSALTFLLPLTAANPPACLLAAVNEQAKPADLAAICGTAATEVQAAIDSACESQNKSVAQAEFLSTCSSAGSSVAAYTPTATDSSTRTGSGASNTASEIAGGASASASGSGSGASGTSGAPSDAKAFGGAVVLVVGVLGLAVGL